MTRNNDERWMHHAIVLAYYAQNQGEVPIGAILVLNNKVIGKGWNQPIESHDPTAHAEIIALRQGGKVLRNYRLTESVLYVTLEPCAMCAGAIVYSRVSRLVYGARASKDGTINTCLHTLRDTRTNHHVQVNGGVLKTECSNILTHFFYQKRAEKRIHGKTILS
ncbi:tRNA-specific adenosine deaminase [Candidatus Erwinia haradaeae]|uniref:tRNA-specific adenosine deaminase n=1 Tax=Candidatus Erwinia haradaeae TaxID=1922217 RepID=A0A451DBW7_9GAMM|nr:tRNA adenosine(34) deaminase TadA [Candidatus Erwinia haradaeae]VFP83900.1 tRNA-specific adenosine deaminase [Candidatus Erwinia haradaeae]